MGIENASESKLICKKNKETLEVRSHKSDNCDIENFISLDYLFDYLIPERICDITVDISKIAVLELSHCNLTELPIACKKLKLKHLGVSHNKLTEVPLCLYSGLKSLESLDLSHNEIESFDIEPECLPCIKIVKLNNNKFSNAPKWLLMFRCTNLEEFNYSHNKAEHYNVSKCLNYLDISNEGTTFANKFDELDDLFVKPKWKEMTVLRLNYLSLSILPEGIVWIYGLKELYITNNYLSWLPDNIGFLTNLEVLDISDNAIVAVPQNIRYLEKLHTLLASNNSIDSVPDLSEMLNLKILDLYNNLLDSAVIFNSNTVELIDLGNNYCNTQNLQDYETYKEKIIEARYDGTKNYVKRSESSSSCRSDDEYYFDNDEIVTTYPATVDDTEDWDLPVKVKRKILTSIVQTKSGVERKKVVLNCLENQKIRFMLAMMIGCLLIAKKVDELF
ncbi:hypothetical protein NQ318_019978 [Aromia moschata]|uniref:Uncharacterized protein n=1 Tax=Aromia moschata TaxID=1265417 RepID=A0AAV8Y5H5_9CUCU|nr:hypothetical protein NQ318_019978 [Aromia moschata]